MTATGEAPSVSSARPDRYPTLEAVRLIAAMLVVCHHVAFTLGTGRAGKYGTPASIGDAGVSIFFVLSGFLIVRPFVVAAVSGQPAPSPGRFFWKRALRIFPAYWLALGTFAAFGTIEFSSVGDALRFAFLLQTFSRNSAIHGLTQSWSLAVEFCFYLLVPIFGLIFRQLFKRLGTRGLWLLPLVLFVSGFVARWAFGLLDRPGVPSTTRALSFLWLPTNIDQFAIGMAIAVASVIWTDGHRGRQVASSIVGWWIAGIAVFVAYAYLIGPVSFDVGYVGVFWQRRQLVYGLIGLCFVVPSALGAHKGRARAVLATPLFVWAGTFSYGVYLWHVDILKELNKWVLEHPNSSMAELTASAPKSWLVYLATASVLSFVAAAVSWFVVEQPTARFRDIRLAQTGRQ